VIKREKPPGRLGFVENALLALSFTNLLFFTIV